MRQLTLIDLDDARPLVAAATRAAAALGVGMAFAVLDAAGHPVLIERMPGAGFLTADIARAKAYASVAWSMDSGAAQDRLSANAPNLVAALATSTGGQFMAQRGAVLIRHSGQIIGAIGASGGTAVQDEEIAAAAVSEVGLT